MSPVITLRARRLAARVLLLVVLVAAVLALHQGHALAWQFFLGPITAGSTDAGLITAPATLAGA